MHRTTLKDEWRIMGIVLTILAIIGKVLLIILCVILILLALLLFVPFQYRLSGEKDSEDTTGMAEITWLFRAIGFTFTFNRNKKESWQKSTELKVFGISPGKIKKERAEKKKNKKKADKKKKLDQLKEDDPEKYEELREAALQRKKERQEEKRREAEEEKARREAEAEAERAETQKNERKKLKKKHKKRRRIRFLQMLMDALKRFFESIGRGFTFLYELPANLAEKIGKFFEKATGICDTIRAWITFLIDPRTFEALKLTGRDIIRLWKRIGPKKLKGDVTYGLEDPSATGKILAAASAFFPVYGPDFVLHPDFEEKKLEGKAELSGRIYLGSVLVVVIGFLLNPNIRYIISCYKARKAK